MFNILIFRWIAPAHNKPANTVQHWCSGYASITSCAPIKNHKSMRHTSHAVFCIVDSVQSHQLIYRLIDAAAIHWTGTAGFATSFMRDRSTSVAYM